MLVSIFNDVIGPVMRGPSSSHCAAALRIDRLARDLVGADLDEVRVEFDPNGSLAGTCGGECGCGPTVPRIDPVPAGIQSTHPADCP